MSAGLGLALNIITTRGCAALALGLAGRALAQYCVEERLEFLVAHTTLSTLVIITLTIASVVTIAVVLAYGMLEVAPSSRNASRVITAAVVGTTPALVATGIGTTIVVLTVAAVVAAAVVARVAVMSAAAVVAPALVVAVVP